MRTSAELAGVEIPPHVFHRNGEFVDTRHQLVVVLLTHAAADNLANLREEHISALHRLAVGILLHVEGLDVLGIVGHDDRTLEMVLHQIALMLTGQVHAPGNGELKLMAGGHGLLQNTDTLCVRQAHKRALKHRLQTAEQRLVDHLVEELQVVLAVLQSPAHTILDKVLLQVHQVIEVDESHLGLNHPKLGQMARRVAVLGAEGGAEGVDGAQGGGTQLAFQLSAHGERGHLAEEVVGIDDAAVLILFQVVQVLRGHLEHLTGALTVAGRDDGGMEIEEPLLMEVGMDGHSHIVAYTHHGTEGVGAQAQVCILAHVLKRLSLLLHGVVIAAGAVEFYLPTLYLRGLTGCGALHQHTVHTEARTCGNLFQHRLVDSRRVYNYLNVLDGGAVVEGDEIYSLAAAVRTHPSSHVDHCAIVLTAQHIHHFRSAYCFHCLLLCVVNVFYSKAPMRSISTSFSVRKRQSPRRSPFLVRPAKSTRSNLVTR